MKKEEKWASINEKTENNKTNNHAITDRSVKLTNSSVQTVNTGDNTTINYKIDEKILKEILNNTSDIDDKFTELTRINSQNIPQDAIDHFVQKHFDKVLKRRFFPEVDTIQELLTIAVRIDSGNLQQTSTSKRVSIFRELAAGYARNDDLDNARKWLDKAKALDPKFDYRVDEARILNIEEKPDEALIILRECESTEANGIILDAIAKKQSFEAAFEYFQKEFKYVCKLNSCGLLSFTSKLIKENQIEVAEKLLSEATQQQIELSPILLSNRALIRFALCLPENQRGLYNIFNLLYSKLTGLSDLPEKIELRKYALADIKYFLQIAKDLDLPKQIQRMEDLEIFLRLNHPDEKVRLAERERIEEEVKDIKKAARMAQFTIEYNIPFDKAALHNYLDQRKILGGWDFYETVAAFCLILYSKDAEKMLLMLQENRSSFSKHINPQFILGLEIEALARSGKIDDARDLIETEAVTYGNAFAIPLRNLLEEICGGDPLILRRKSFAETGAIAERGYLVDELLKQGFYSEAAEHLVEIFNQYSTVQHALQIGQCYLNAHEYDNLHNFLERADVDNLASISNDLKIFKAWSLFYSGNMHKAYQLINAFVDYKYDNDNIKRLLYNLAVESGRWDELHGFLKDILVNKNDNTARELIAAAGAGSIINFSRNEDLVYAAAEKALAGDDPDILIASYDCVFRLGIEEERMDAQRWIERAYELSGPDGPVRIGKISDFKNLIKESREKNEFINNKVIDGDIPLEFALKPLNTTLTDIFIGNFLRNSESDDNRFKVGLPLFAGNRIFAPLKDVKRIALDRTSIMTFAYLGHLEKVLDAFDKVVIPRGAMAALFADIGKVRFHQPSRIDAAERLLSHVTNSKIQVLQPNENEKSSALAEDADQETRRLIRAAEQDGGVVIVSPPIYKAGSYMEEVVDVSPFSHHICGFEELFDFLIEESIFGEDDIEDKRNQIHIQLERWEKCAQLYLSKCLYLTDLAAQKLEKLDLIPLLARNFPSVIIDKSTKDNASALISHQKYQEQVEGLIENIRKVVSKNIESGKISISPAHKLEISKNENLEDNSLLYLFSDPGDVEVIIVDDRAMNKFPEINDIKGRTMPVATSIDTLLYLKERLVISEEELVKSFRKLRNAGALFVPFLRNELVDAVFRSIKRGKDSFEYKSIANYIDFANTRKIIKLPEERIWFSDLFHKTLLAVKRVWNEATSVEDAEDAAFQLLDILPDITEWIQQEHFSDRQLLDRRFKGIQLAILGEGYSLSNPDRLYVYLQWVERNIIRPGIWADEKLLSYTTEYLKNVIFNILEEIPEKIEDEIRSITLKEAKDIVVNNYIDKMSPSLRNSMLNDVNFKNRFGGNLISVMNFSNNTVPQNNALKFIEAVINGSELPKLIDIYGKDVNSNGIIHSDGSIEITIDKFTYTLHAAALLGGTKKIRNDTLNYLFTTFKVSKSMEQKWRKRVRKSPLSIDEYADLVGYIENRAEYIIKRIVNDIFQQNRIDFNTLIPEQESTFYDLLGDPKIKRDFNKYKDTVLYHQRKILINRCVKSDFEKSIELIGPSWIVPDENVIKLMLKQNEELLKNALYDASCYCCDPFTLIFILEICSKKVAGDPAYIKIGKGVLQKLNNADKNNIIQDFGIILPVVINKLTETRILAGQPLYFRRLAAWTWAGLISRHLSRYLFDRQRFVSDFINQYIFKSYASGFVERWEAPYWRSEWITNHHLAALIQKRISLLISQHLKAEDVPIEWHTELKQYLKEDPNDELSLSFYLPGPIDGFSDSASPLVDCDKEIEDKLLEDDLCADAVSFVQKTLNLGYITNLSPEMIDRVKAESRCILDDKKSIISGNGVSNVIQALSHLSGIRRDSELAVLAADIARELTERNEGKTASLEFFFVVDAAGAFDEPDKRNDFIRDRLERLAFGKINQQEANICLDALENLIVADPELSMHFGRARAALRISSRS